MKVRRIRSHYERRVAPERESHEILDWGSRKDQEARFAVLLEVLRRLPPRSYAHSQSDTAPRLLDVGCGLTDLCSFLGRAEQPVRYVGVDITFPILEEARRRWPGRDTLMGDVFTHAPFATEAIDLAFCSGIFNLRLGNNDAFAARAVASLLALCSRCVVANFLHCRTRRQYPHCFYYDPERVCSAVRQTASRVELVDDYLENDFTVVAWV